MQRLVMTVISVSKTLILFKFNCIIMHKFISTAQFVVFTKSY